MVQDDAVIYMPVSNTSENNGNDAEQNQVLIQTEKRETLQETDDKNTPGDVVQTAVTTPADLRTLLANWWKVILGIAGIVGIIAGIACFVYFTGGNRNLSIYPTQLAHNTSEEVVTANTTNQTKNNLCSKLSISKPEDLMSKYHLLDNTKEIIYLTLKMTQFEAKKHCRERGGQLFTPKNPKILEAFKCIPGLSHWLSACCASSGICTWPDGSLFDPSLYNASLPWQNRESCVTSVSGKVTYEMCTDSRSVLCERPTKH